MVKIYVMYSSPQLGEKKNKNESQSLVHRQRNEIIPGHEPEELGTLEGCLPHSVSQSWKESICSIRTESNILKAT